jgi:hypothetical protein
LVAVTAWVPRDVQEELDRAAELRTKVLGRDVSRAQVVKELLMGWAFGQMARKEKGGKVE